MRRMEDKKSVDMKGNEKIVELTSQLQVTGTLAEAVACVAIIQTFQQKS